jgi:hypothetical protein
VSKVKKKSTKADMAKLRKDADKVMDEFIAESKARYDQAWKLIEFQDEQTKDAIERMTFLLARIARRRMWVGVGKREDRIVLDIPEQTIEHNVTYMAVEILKDLGHMDVQVERFDFNPGLCAECHVPVKPSKKKRS